jgi:general secretion pathway protein A
VQPEVLEQIRLLSNIDAAAGTMLQIILVGQLDLEALLARPELRQFQQRVSRRIRLEPLSAHELGSYIDHRLAVGRAVRSRMPGADELERALAEWDDSVAGVAFSADAVQAIWRLSCGLPRVVNLLCDRALEAACAQRLRTIDVALIDTTALALDLRPPAEADAPPPVTQPAEAAAATIPAAFDLELPTTAPRAKRVAGLIAAVAVAALASWFIARNPNRSVDRAPVASHEPTPLPAPAETAPATAPSAPAPTAPAEAAAAGQIPPTGRFDIIVASFRTEARAASVLAEVSNIGLPVRQRALGGWQQVLAGPFASREEAEEARQRLERAGLPNTEIVSAVR